MIMEILYAQSLFKVLKKIILKKFQNYKNKNKKLRTKDQLV